MGLSKVVRRELEVAFSRKSQPLWLRIMKYLVLGLGVYFFWGHEYFWQGLAAMIVLALAVHFWVRHKTAGWTKSYGLWKYDGGDS
ncbi:MAG TPA: hypothetical protein VG737_13195 [Cyclobacteriaceae bacterium]|nr:hypothetical protein [Cyclobacteriaceae bacterium]